LVLADIARKIKGPSETLEAVEKRLSRQMKSSHWNCDQLREVLLSQMATGVKENTLIAVDITDLAKPRARKMEGVDYVWDGSRKEPVTGYWLFESYAALSKGKLLPLLCFAYTLRTQQNRSQNWVTLESLMRLKEVLGDRGILLFDRGFDNGEFLQFFEERNIRFVLRLRGDRGVLDSWGESLGSARNAAAELPDRWWYQPRKAAGVGRLGWREVRLPGCKGRFNLVVSRWPGSGKEPLLLLTNLEVKAGLGAERVLWMYLMRWNAEDAARFLKQEVGLESFLVRSLRGIEKLVTVAFMVMAFLGVLAEVPKVSLERLLSLGLSFRKRVDFMYYRIVWGLQVLLEELKRVPQTQTG
jgi:hypothetical protein